MKTEAKLGHLSELVHAFELADIPYMVIAGWALDGLRGKQTRPHQDIDVLCDSDSVLDIGDTLENFGYTGKWDKDLFKAKRKKDGAKVDACLLRTERSGLAATHGRIAITRFPGALTIPQFCSVDGVSFNIAPDELLKKWGMYSRHADDYRYAKSMQVNPELYASIDRKLRQ